MFLSFFLGALPGCGPLPADEAGGRVRPGRGSASDGSGGSGASDTAQAGNADGSGTDPGNDDENEAGQNGGDASTAGNNGAGEDPDDNDSNANAGDQAGDGASNDGPNGDPIDDPEDETAGAGGEAGGEGADDEPAPTPPDPLTDENPNDPLAEAPAGKVPMFLALGYGGRIVASCDDGRNWDIDSQDSNSDGWHEDYSPKGLVYGNGKFVALQGWYGNSKKSRVKVSEDGVNWQTHRLSGQFGSIGFADGTFYVVGTDKTIKSTNGKDWSDGGPGMGGSHVRTGNGRGEFVTSGLDGKPRYLKNNKWVDIPGCGDHEWGGLGHVGGIEYGNGRFVSVKFTKGNDVGKSCGVTLDGDRLDSFNFGKRLQGNFTFFRGKFWMPAKNRLFTSTDGENWEVTRLEPYEDVSVRLLAQGDTGTFVGLSTNGEKFYRSFDGVNWVRVPGANKMDLARVVFGYVKPSDKCPLD